MTLAVNIAQGGSNNVTMRNRIINGNMVINQRSFNGTITTDTTYTLDRFVARTSVGSKYSISQNAGSVTSPAGFTNYLGVTSLAATTVGAGDFYCVQQVIEGFNMADLNWGSSTAKPITISFWVYSSLTGTFGGGLTNYANSYSYPFSYTISSANTWTQISVTAIGPTSGTWVGATNAACLNLTFSLGMGSTYSTTAGAWVAGNYLSATGATSVVGTNGATFYITGVQLEAGTTASPFEYRQYGTELALCQRYYWQNGDGTTDAVGVRGDGLANGTWELTMAGCPVVMRTLPSVTTVAGSILNASSITWFAKTGCAGTILATSAIFSGGAGTAKYSYVWKYTMNAEL